MFNWGLAFVLGGGGAAAHSHSLCVWKSLCILEALHAFVDGA